MRYALVGYGRMGRAIDVLAQERGHERVALIGSRAAARAAPIDRATLGGAEVAFEFTRPEAAEANVVALLEAGLRVVSGTTGWTAGPAVHAAAVSGRTGAVIAPNFSVGMGLFLRLVEQAARIVAAAGLHEPWVFEAHHRGKLDAPSGTAARLASVLLRADPRLDGVLDAAAGAVARPGKLPLVSLRAGHEPGRHTVGFDGEHDCITLTHRARGRTGFAAGALLAAEWIHGREGLHGFEAVLSHLSGDAGAPAGEVGTREVQGA